MPVNQTADQAKHVLSQSAATQAHYDTDEQGFTYLGIILQLFRFGVGTIKKRIQKIGGDCYKYSYLLLGSHPVLYQILSYCNQ